MGDDEQRAPDRPVQCGGNARVRADDGVEAQFRAGAEHVESQIAAGEAQLELIRGRVLEVDAEHQERRSVALVDGIDRADPRRRPRPR